MRRQPTTPACLLPLLLTGLLLSVSCTDKEDNEPKKDQPQVKVNLPPSPEMAEKRFVAQYVDGSYRVEGLIKERSKLLGKQVAVKGFIKEVRRCPEGETACDPPPHAVLVDDLARPGRRLVLIGGPGTRFDGIEQGMKDTFDGIYRTTDPDGLFVRMEGLLVLTAVKKPEPETPPPSPEEN